MFSTNHSEIEILSRTSLHSNGKVAQEFKGKRHKENNVSSVLFFYGGGILQHLQRKMDRPGESVLISTP